MHYSRLFLNRQSRAVRRDLADPFQMHRTVMSAFPQLTERDRHDPESGSILWRVDHDQRSGVTMLIVQSELAPDWKPLLDRQPDYVASPLGSDLPPLDSKQRQLALAAGQFLSFRLRANPTKRCKADGRRIGLTSEEDQLAWLHRKANDEKQPSGFRLHSAVVIAEEPPVARRSPKGVKADDEVSSLDSEANTSNAAVAVRKMTHLAVRFEGVLQVVDPVAFQQTLRRGIGSAKGFGFGLLSIARCE